MVKGIAKNASFLFPGNFFLPLPCESGVLFSGSHQSLWNLTAGTVQKRTVSGEELVSCSAYLQEISVLTVAALGARLLTAKA